MGDSSWPKQSKRRTIGNICNLAYWISAILLYWDISHTHLSYKQVEQVQLKQVYWRILYVKCTFSHKWVIPKYCLYYLNELTFYGNLFSFIELLTIFWTVFISYLMVINSDKYKSNYPNTIWWIMSCIMGELWKKIAINNSCCLIWHRLIRNASIPCLYRRTRYLVPWKKIPLTYFRDYWLEFLLQWNIWYWFNVEHDIN